MLVGADQPVWMTGIVEMTRTFGLELLESMLTQFPSVFSQHAPFRALLKERVCSLVIKLFSPNIKHNNRGNGLGNSSGGQGGYYNQVIAIVIYLLLQSIPITTLVLGCIFQL